MKQFFTRNLFIVIAVGVAVLALVAVLFPWYKVSEATEHGAELEQLHRRLQIAFKNAESPQWVKKSDEGIRNIREAQEKVIASSLLFGTRRPLLVDGKLVFPHPVQVDGFNFRFSYAQSLPKWLTGLEAGGPPSASEVNKLVESLKIPAMGSSGKSTVDEKSLQKQARDRLIGQRADKCRLWATEASFDDYIEYIRKFLQPGGGAAGGRLWKPMNARQLWQALVNWWIQNDLVEVIKSVNTQPVPYRMADGRMNKRAPKNVRESPVKELVWINVAKEYYRGPGRRATGEQASGSLTGHVTCDKYDVVHYSFQVVMDVQDLPLLVGVLSSKNFHTVLSLDCQPLDKKGTRRAGRSGRGAAAPSGVPGADYGPDFVMVVTVQCEAVFMKSPLSWRTDPVLGRKKRLEFFRKHPELVLKVLKRRPGGGVQEALSNQQLAKDKSTLDAWLKQDDPNVQFVALYEDLMPQVVRAELPGFSGARR